LAEFTLRPATEADSPAIRSLVREVHINPSGLHWKRFILAVTPDEKMIGCGQIKPHHDGTRELASLAVWPEYRRQGVARAIMAHLMVENPPPLYLVCRSELGMFYEKFGFRSVLHQELPPYFRRMMNVAKVFLPVEILVMVYNGAGSSA
jgi:N-acetylglutamate synthase-like GNAT family acetyltransferase